MAQMCLRSDEVWLFELVWGWLSILFDTGPRVGIFQDLGQMVPAMLEGTWYLMTWWLALVYPRFDSCVAFEITDNEACRLSMKLALIVRVSNRPTSIGNQSQMSKYMVHWTSLNLCWRLCGCVEGPVWNPFGFCLAHRLGTESQEKLLKAARWVPWAAVDPSACFLEQRKCSDKHRFV